MTCSVALINRFGRLSVVSQRHDYVTTYLGDLSDTRLEVIHRDAQHDAAIESECHLAARKCDAGFARSALRWSHDQASARRSLGVLQFG
jgi:hypothetical protein